MILEKENKVDLIQLGSTGGDQKQQEMWLGQPRIEEIDGKIISLDEAARIVKPMGFIEEQCDVGHKNSAHTSHLVCPQTEPLKIELGYCV
uniref:Uncharacterized protein n=1 Tax=Romanomermis culicivorax TaxID=13658 RepID=A0A915IWY1_ROMCU